MAVSLDTILWFADGLTVAILICLLLYRRLWQTFPVFFLYVVQALTGDIVAAIILHSARSYYTAWYIVGTVADSVLLLGVLVELSWSILRPVQASLSRRALIPVIGLVLIIGAIVWKFAALPNLSGAVGAKHLIAQLQQTVSILQILTFLALIAGAQVLSLSWRDRELQITTGLGFYSFVRVSTALLAMHGTSWLQYRHLSWFDIGAELCCLLYWIVSFSQKEAERRQFTPEMQRILLSVAGAAHATRVSLTEPQTSNTRK